MRAHLVEHGIIVALVIAATARAAFGEAGLIVAILHASTLFLVFAVVRAVFGKLHFALGRLVFCFFATILIAEIAIQFLTGLHVNWFVISLFLEPQSGLQTGVSLPSIIVITLALTAALWIVSRKTVGLERPVPFRKIAILAVAALGLTQLTYGVSYFFGASEIMSARRALPFFWAPHPYQSNKLLAVIFGPRGTNPFAISEVDTRPAKNNQSLPVVPAVAGTVDLATAPNIILIVTDSLRSKDIQAAPELMPSLYSAAESGFLSLDHYSVSNCTHFSMYSLLTGKLATSFGKARRSGKKHGILATLSQSGYRISTAESATLDWYDVSDILLPATTERWIAEGEDGASNDLAITERTIAMINSWQENNFPTAHLAYFVGTHFPYSSAFSASGASTRDAYIAATKQFDKLLGSILKTLSAIENERETLVIVTSDHGEDFLENGQVGHASQLNDEQVKVPLLILGTGDMTASVKSHLDIAPLIAGATGLSSSTSLSDETIVLAGCDYDYPNSFAVLGKDTRIDFLYDDGYLVPVAGENSPSEAEVNAAAAKLLRLIRE